MNKAEDCILTNQIAIMEALQELCPRHSHTQKRLIHRIRRTSHFLDYNNHPGHIKEWDDIAPHPYNSPEYITPGGSAP